MDKNYFDVVFDGPPEHEAGRFVEVEDADGNGIHMGEWIKRDDGYWVLRFPRPAPAPDQMRVALEKAKTDIRATLDYTTPMGGSFKQWHEEVTARLWRVVTELNEALQSAEPVSQGGKWIKPGEGTPDDCPVWYKYPPNNIGTGGYRWYLSEWRHVKHKGPYGLPIFVLAEKGQGPPPDGWKPRGKS